MSDDENFKIATLTEKLSNCIKTVEALDKRLEDLGKTFVTKTEFKPIANIFWSFVTLSLMSLLGAVLSLIIIKYK